VIPNGISPEDFEGDDTEAFRAKYGLGSSPFLLFMGRLNEIKGPDILLDAYASIANQFPEWQLVFAGPDGGLEQAVRNAVVEYRLENRVHIIGFVAGKDKSAAYHAASLLVIPSRLEAMSIVALEAGACGTPIVMTDQCGFYELVEAGGGVEVAVDPKALAITLSELLSNPKAVKTMGEKAERFIHRYYTWEMMAKQHKQLCEEVCDERVKK